ncbi:MAG: hypothetical protein ACO1OT_18080 [Heyndrickxia sp.]
MEENLKEDRLKHFLLDAYEKAYQINYTSIEEFINEMKEQLLVITSSSKSYEKE